MKVIGAKLREIGMMVTLLSMVHMVSCEDRLDTPRPSTGDGKLVEVTLSVGIAGEAEAAPSGTGPSTTKATANGGKGSFNVQLTPSSQTKAGGDDVLSTAKPDQLYNLQILQYVNGVCKAVTTSQSIAVGTSFTASLTQSDHCRLIIVARGSDSTIPMFSGTPTLSSLQSILADSAKINKINSSADINAMPYMLDLQDVNVTAAGNIQSPDGKDVRILLKRLAVRLTVTWAFKNTSMKLKDYTLKEVKLCQVPSVYRVFPQTENTTGYGTIYPISAVEYKDLYRLKEDETLSGDLNQGTKTVWIPANAKGNPSNVTSPYYRTKDYAHSAATYMEFVVDNAVKNERLYYRAYLGGEDVSDFNLLENTNYNYTISIMDVDYIGDPRIQLLDQTPVISTNLVPTSNCFMMRPGTNLCFNPYKHTAGTNGWNTYLAPSGEVGAQRTIDGVEVMWQTKDAGTTGDLVMGYIVDKTNHKNLVNLTGDDRDNTLVHVKVPVTKGGNALIAAYHTDTDGKRTIVWSWHLWITDYVPQGISQTMNYAQAQQSTAGGSVHQYPTSAFQAGGMYEKKVLMDRNLCATAGGFPGHGSSSLEFGKRIGYLYAWGRKDPFFGSVDGSANEIDIIYDGMGYSMSLPIAAYSNDNLVNGNMMQWSIEHPATFLTGQLSWYNGNEGSDEYLYLWSLDGKKTIYDPCPYGWRISDKAIWGSNTSNSYWYNANGTFVASGTYHDLGGRLYNLTGGNGVPSPQTIHNTAWYPMTTYRGYSSGILSRAQAGYLGSVNIAKAGSLYRIYYVKYSHNAITSMGNTYGYIGEPYPFRCIQE